MRGYVNDASLQGQFSDAEAFEDVIRELLRARSRIPFLRDFFHLSRTLPERNVLASETVRHLILKSKDKNFKSAVLIWLDRSGPFFEDDRIEEVDDYFEFSGLDVTDTGLGEGARRIRKRQEAFTFSFIGGHINFNCNPLVVEHGIPGDRLGVVNVPNVWELDELMRIGTDQEVLPTSWQGLIEFARVKFPALILPDSLYLDARLNREPFDSVIRDRVFVLLGVLNDYAEGRNPDGSESEISRRIIENFFVGDRALFSGESKKNQENFRNVLTFPDPTDPAKTIFGHWHGKISHRFYRLHFDWPIDGAVKKIKILYIGPKLTKS